MNRLADFYGGRTVMVTGHTGFKGAWLSAWLLHLGARVVGFALAPPSSPNNFEACRLQERMEDLRGDVCDPAAIAAAIAAHRPSLVFHLAAQSLVRPAIADPIGTFRVNVMGTVNVLDAALRSGTVDGVISVTSDKCYQNNNWVWGYRETDTLGGHEPYSASKACAELAVACFQNASFQSATSAPRALPIATVRAGNVIGGGDWATNRIIPDVVRSIVDARDVVVRNPTATRPWQHVLEPLSGYLWLGCHLLKDSGMAAEAWNFGPRDDESWNVERVVLGILERWRGSRTRLTVEADLSNTESRLLRLDCVKAQEFLGWQASWSVPEALDAIVSWYQRYYADPGSDMFSTAIEQMETYSARARQLGRSWALASRPEVAS